MNFKEAYDVGKSVINSKRPKKTDPFFCGLLFVVFLTTVGFAIFGFVGGGTVAFAPFLADGTQCGHYKSVIGASDVDARGYPYLYFPVYKKKLKNKDRYMASLWD